ncbi:MULTISPECIES: hypothetical protein [Aminobacter]|jgi:hypothetical protein|uniref:Uncharacterized protein n=2 Tax=Aminobacter TaxID=31988 RepID=A0AAC8YPE6_AMIAI|nr:MULTISPECIES: hypothetical protein [Aminobacter]AMS41873.1 hypothetical protein AA2016_2949 [Aminobacter aminovorans]MBA8904754.1 hypothetical protein [Aminobacter ciceronei]MBA9018692.1 hypothetical protein [Aminobacter ciceronei]MBB3703778.1 hypothetical protein [Aminobacter aminovorans]MRX31466.1 hypothetical protein [Aminobacter sp. MDW-2]
MRLSCSFLPRQVIVGPRRVAAGEVEINRKSDTRETVRLASTLQRLGVAA